MMSHPVTHEGVTYPSQAALARALGVSRSAVSLALRDGWMDCLGSGGREAGLSAAHTARRQPLQSLGWAWKSQRDCARALGVADGRVSEALDRGTLDALVQRHLGPKTAAGGGDAA